MFLPLSIIVLVVGSARAGLLNSPKAQGDDLEALCQNKTVKLTRLSELSKLVGKLDDDQGAECGDNTVAALRDLMAVVDANRGQECSLAAYERFKTFHLTYVKRPEADKRKEFVKLPRPVRQLALAYGMQLASMCRANMVGRLLDDAEALADPRDFDEVQELIDPEGPISMALGYTGSRPDEIVLPGDLLALTDEVSEKKVAIKIKTAPLIKRVLELCRERFRPVYAPLMLPVAKLANLGFTYRSGMLEEAVQQAEASESSSDVIGKWARVAFLCEVVSEIEILEDAEDGDQAEGNDVTQVRVLSSKDAEALKESGRARSVLDAAESEGRPLQQVDFEPSLWVNLPDEILSSRRMSYRVAHFDTDADEAKIIRKRLLMKILRRLWRDVSSRNASSLFTSLTRQVKELRKRNDAKSIAPSDNLVASINDLVDHKLNADKAVSRVKGSGIIVIVAVIFSVALVCLFIAGLWYLNNPLD